MTVHSIVDVELGYLPASMNRTMYAHWSASRRAKLGLQRDLEVLLMAAGLPRPIPQPVEASAVLVVPDRRRRDEGNYRAPLEKALGDALVNGGWLVDDSPEHFRFGRVEFDHRPGQRRTSVRLSWPAEQERAA